jgi:hypothetical protein
VTTLWSPRPHHEAGCRYTLGFRNLFELFPFQVVEQHFPACLSCPFMPGRQLQHTYPFLQLQPR